MMKQMTAVILFLCLAVGLSACGAGITPKQNAETASFAESTRLTESDKTTQEPSQSDEVLIVYFSIPEDVGIDGVDAVAGASIVVSEGEIFGNTEHVATLVQKTIGGDVIRIETVEPYPLDHEPLVDQAAEEQDAGLRPDLSTRIENLDQYEFILLGYPNWWGDMPQPLYTFLEENDFGGKTVIPFITHGGSGSSRTLDTIAKLQPGARMLDNALVLSRNDVAGSEEMVEEWAQGLGIPSRRS